MDIKKTLHFIYGIFLGTSVDYVETHKKRPKSEFQKINEKFYVMKQTDHECGILLNDSKILLINTSYGTSCEELVIYIKDNFTNHKVTDIAYSSKDMRAVGGTRYYPDHKPWFSGEIKWGSQTVQIQNGEIAIGKIIFKNYLFQF